MDKIRHAHSDIAPTLGNYVRSLRAGSTLYVSGCTAVGHPFGERGRYRPGKRHPRTYTGHRPLRGRVHGRRRQAGNLRYGHGRLPSAAAGIRSPSGTLLSGPVPHQHPGSQPRPRPPKPAHRNRANRSPLTPSPNPNSIHHPLRIILGTTKNL